MSINTSGSPLAALRNFALAFDWAFLLCASAAPLGVTLFAWIDSPDAVLRAQTIVGGFERILLLLLAALVVRAFYLIGAREGALLVDAKAVQGAAAQSA